MFYGILSSTPMPELGAWLWRICFELYWFRFYSKRLSAFPKEVNKLSFLHITHESKEIQTYSFWKCIVCTMAMPIYLKRFKIRKKNKLIIEKKQMGFLTWPKLLHETYLGATNPKLYVCISFDSWVICKKLSLFTFFGKAESLFEWKRNQYSSKQIHRSHASASGLHVALRIPGQFSVL